MEINFKVTFLSDVVLNSSSNTEGNVDNLDFITGSSFLGMVAKNYDKFENPFEVFHSGKVRFGEATLLFNNKATYKTPFCFFKPKVDIDYKEVYNNHFVDYSEQNILDKQLKQLRSGYITSSLDYVNLDYNYSQKAAYDSKKRKSEDSKMFGYNAIKRGTIWKFSIKFDEIGESIQDQVLEYILGEKYLGKSKTSQYGKVLIEKFDDFKEENLENLNSNDITYVYVNSSLALFDENGMPTFEPTKDNLGLIDASIDWTKTQIRTKTITPYNFKRQTNDYTRLIIERGSVIALTNTSQEDIEILKKGIGGYLSEGYGEVLINPSFLLKKDVFSLNKVKLNYVEEKTIETKLDENLIAFLTNQKESKETIYDLGKEVQDFIERNKSKFKTVSKSQWGQIRMIVQVYQKDKKYINEIKDFISHGTSQKQWENGFKELEKILASKNIEFIKLLSMMMPKVKMEKEND